MIWTAERVVKTERMAQEILEIISSRLVLIGGQFVLSWTILFLICLSIFTLCVVHQTADCPLIMLSSLPSLIKLNQPLHSNLFDDGQFRNPSMSEKEGTANSSDVSLDYNT